jgi:hypothetical protein
MVNTWSIRSTTESSDRVPNKAMFTILSKVISFLNSNLDAV